MREAPFSPGKGLWFAALLSAALLHFGLAAVAFWSSLEIPQGQARAAGTGGIEISLGPSGSSAGGPRNQQGEQSVEQLAEPEPKPVVEPLTESEPVREKKPKFRPRKITEHITKPIVEPEPKPAPKNPVPESPVEPTPEAATIPPTASVAGSAGKSGTTKQNDTGSGNNTDGGGLPGETRDYAATLLAWLEQYKEYPRRARIRRQQGTVMLYFVIDHQGKVLEHRIDQSSGYRALDKEVLRMIQRAQPLPAMPTSMKRHTLELVVPVQFLLR